MGDEHDHDGTFGGEPEIDSVGGFVIGVAFEGVTCFSDVNVGPVVELGIDFALDFGFEFFKDFDFVAPAFHSFLLVLNIGVGDGAFCGGGFFGGLGCGDFFVNLGDGGSHVFFEIHGNDVPPEYFDPPDGAGGELNVDPHVAGSYSKDFFGAFGAEFEEVACPAFQLPVASWQIGPVGFVTEEVLPREVAVAWEKRGIGRHFEEFSGWGCLDTGDLEGCEGAEVGISRDVFPGSSLRVETRMTDTEQNDGQ